MNTGKTTRQEMELAARAAGYEIRFHSGTCKGGEYEGCEIKRGDEWVAWRPLEDDGDSRRLQVDLHLATAFHPVLYQAMRLAVFRAAVELGKCLP